MMKRILGVLALTAIANAGCSPAPETALLNSQPAQGGAAISRPLDPGFAAEGMDTPAMVPQSSSAPIYVQTAANSATLKAKFVLNGDPKPPEKIDGSRDPFCADLQILSETLVVGEGGAIRDVMLFLDRRNTDVDIPEIPVPEVAVQLDNKQCVFVPHVFSVRAGQSIRATNSDNTGHNANFTFFANDPVNFLIPAGGEKAIEVKAEESQPMPVECNIHPWMKAYVMVTDHPFVGITNEKGELTIENLPVGKVGFRVWHGLKARIDEGTVAGEKQKWNRGTMELELKPGVNDLGTITIDKSMFE